MAKRKYKSYFDIIVNDNFIEQENTKKRFTLHDLRNFNPKTEPQSDFFHHYYDKGCPIIMQIGSAGTGKTVVALYAALSEIFSGDSPYKKIIIVRSAVQAREIGYLKGDENEKNEVYEAPYVSLCDELMKYKSNNYRNLKDKGIIEFETTSFMRGKTWDNSIVIVDECQNMNYGELSTVTTRLGYHSRIIFCGDYKQNDLTQKKTDKSGLQDFMRVLNKMNENSTGIIEYRPEDIVRSGIVREFLMAAEEVS